MDAPTALRRARWPAVESPVLPQLARVVAASLFALLTVAALVICARRAGGALTEPLSTGVLCALAGVLAAASIAFRRTVAVQLPAGGRLARYALWAVPSAVLALWVLGLSLQATPSGGLIGLVGLLLLEEGWSWGRFRQSSAAGRERGSVTARDDAARRAPADVLVEPDDEAAEQSDPGISQRFVRRQGEVGEQIEGWVRAEFAPSQRQAAAHLAICPPFARVPECFAEPADGPPSQVKVAQVLPYGVRLEIKLDEPAAETSQVTVEFMIAERPFR